MQQSQNNASSVHFFRKIHEKKGFRQCLLDKMRFFRFNQIIDPPLNFGGPTVVLGGQLFGYQRYPELRENIFRGVARNLHFSCVLQKIATKTRWCRVLTSAEAMATKTNSCLLLWLPPRTTTGKLKHCQKLSLFLHSFFLFFSRSF